MSKYDPLGSYLGGQTSNECTLTFSEVERIIRTSLPGSARRYRAWWSNGDHVQAKSWMAVGWLVDRVDFDGETVDFRRSQPTAAPELATSPAEQNAPAGGPATTLYDPLAPETDHAQPIRKRKSKSVKRLKRIDRNLAETRRNARRIVRDVAALSKLAKENAKANADVLARLDAVEQAAMPPAVTSSPSPPVEEPKTTDAGTPFGFWGTTGIALVCVLAFFLAAILYAAVYAAFAMPVPSEQAIEALWEDGGFVESIVIVGGVVGLLAILLACWLRRGISVGSYLAMSRPDLTLALWVLAGLIVYWLSMIVVSLIDPSYDAASTSWWSEYMEVVADAPLMFAFSAIVIAPLLEEALFRGFLFAGWSRSIGVGWTIFLTAALWTIAHVQYGLHELVPLFVWGVLLGYARHRSKSLWVPVSMHAVINLQAVGQLITY